MTLNRRAMLGALSLGAAASAAAAQEAPTAPQAQPSLADRITERAREHRFRLAFDGRRFSGDGYDELLAEGRAAHFFCIGEEHGIAENPTLAGQLFADLRFERACVEISPPMAAELDRAARGGVAGLRELFSDPGAQVAFFGMREEAEWLAAARAAAPTRGQAIWGLDYEVGGDRRIIQRLKAKRKNARAAAALAALEAASNQAWAQYASTRSPQYIFSFSGDPDLVHAVQLDWQDADAEAALMLETLAETLSINRYWVRGEGWYSNQRRAEFNRANLRRYWAAHGEDPPKTMFKFGSSHMVRGLSHTQVFDIGAQIAERAEFIREQSFHVFVLPGAGAQVAQFDPSAWTYRPSDAGTYEDEGMTPLTAAAYPDAFTLHADRSASDTAPGVRPRPQGAGRRPGAHHPRLRRVMSGSTPSANL